MKPWIMFGALGGFVAGVLFMLALYRITSAT